MRMHEERRLLEPTVCAFGTFSADITLRTSMFDPEQLRWKADRTHLLMGASLFLGLMGLGVADQRWPKGSRKVTIPFSGNSGDIFSVEMMIPLDLNLEIPEDALYSSITGNVVSPVLNAIGYFIDERDHLVVAPEVSLASQGDTSHIDRLLQARDADMADEAPGRTSGRRRATTRAGA